MTTKDKLNKLTKSGFSNGFISKNVNISSTRLYNAGGDRSVKLAPVEIERIPVFYEIAMKLIKVGEV